MQKGMGLISILISTAVIAALAIFYFSRSHSSPLQNPEKTIIDPIQDAEKTADLINQRSADINDQLR